MSAAQSQHMRQSRTGKILPDIRFYAPVAQKNRSQKFPSRLRQSAMAYGIEKRPPEAVEPSPDPGSDRYDPEPVIADHTDGRKRVSPGKHSSVCLIRHSRLQHGRQQYPPHLNAVSPLKQVRIIINRHPNPCAISGIHHHFLRTAVIINIRKFPLEDSLLPGFHHSRSVNHPHSHPEQSGSKSERDARTTSPYRHNDSDSQHYRHPPIRSENAPTQGDSRGQSRRRNHQRHF